MGSSCRGVVVAIGLGIGLVPPATASEWAIAPAGDLQPCPSQGAGFVRAPGGATCLRLSGRVAAGLAVNRPDRPGPAAPLAMGRLSIDTRTATEYGPVRAFVRMGAGRR